MITFKELLAQKLITEEIHKELQSIIDEPEAERGERPAFFAHQNKLNTFTKKFKTLVKNGEDTGLEDGTPKKVVLEQCSFLKNREKFILMVRK